MELELFDFSLHSASHRRPSGDTPPAAAALCGPEPWTGGTPPSPGARDPGAATAVSAACPEVQDDSGEKSKFVFSSGR